MSGGPFDMGGGNTNIQKVNTNRELVTFDFGDQDGAGGEDVTVEDLPRAALRIAQDKTKQCNERDEKYLPGLKPGMIFNTATLQMWDGVKNDKDGSGGVMVLPVKYLKRIIEWKPNREGYAGEHLLGSEIMDGAEWREVEGKKLLIAKNGNSLVSTYIFHCFLFTNLRNNKYDYDEIIVDMAVSNANAAKLWLAYMRSNAMIRSRPNGSEYKLPFFANIYNLNLTYNSDHGGYFQWNARHASDTDGNLLTLQINSTQGVPEQIVNEHRRIYAAAIEHKNLIEAGKVERSYETEQSADSTSNNTVENNENSSFTQ